MRLALSLLIVLLLSTVSVCQALNRYVRAGAAGANNGTDWTNAYTQLSTCENAMARGDVCYVAGGAYTGVTFNATASGTTVNTIKKATVADHGTATGWSDSFGTTQATFSGGFDFLTSYWLVDGITGGGVTNQWVNNFGFKVTEVGNSLAVIRTGFNVTANNITVRHVDLQGKGSVSTAGGFASNDCLGIYQSSDVTLSSYWMHGCGRCPVFSSGVNVLLEHGLIQQFFGDSNAHSEIASLWSNAQTIGTHTFRYNFFAYTFSTGGLMWDNQGVHSAELRVYGNVFYEDPVLSGSTNDANGWIGGWTGGGGEDTYTMRIYNNTFIGLTGPAGVFTDFQVRSGDNIAQNNLFYNVSAAIAYTTIGTHGFNHYINSGGTHGEGTSTSAASGNPFVGFTAPTYNFSLAAATTAGTPLSAPYTQDMYGTTRGADGTWDRGAVEFAPAASAPPTVTITAPTSGTTHSTTTTPLTTLAGTAADDVGVLSVTWACPTCTPTSGTATCASCGAAATAVTWSVASIGLASGAQVLTLTATDGDTQTGTDTLTVTYTPLTAAPPVLHRLR